MHWFDIVILVLAFVLLILGIKRGLILEIMRLLAVVSGFAAGVYFCKSLSSKFTFLAVSSTIKAAIAFILIFCVVVVLVVLIGWALKKVVHFTPLGTLDRIGGGGIGLVKTFFLAWVFLYIVMLLPVPQAQAEIQKSKTAGVYRGFFKIVKIPGRSVHHSADKGLKPEPGKIITDVQNKIDDFREKVDSVKSKENINQNNNLEGKPK